MAGENLSPKNDALGRTDAEENKAAHQASVVVGTLLVEELDADER
jgi:hypothetical protein